jgi:hypothetical protein
MTMNTRRNTVQQLIPAIGAVVMVRFESITVACTVCDAKNAYGRVRLLITPELGSGSQWVELERLVAGELGMEVSR